MTISGYAWGHIVATGPQLLSAGTSAPLILTHNLLQFDAKAVNDQQAALSVSAPTANGSVSTRSSHLLFDPFRRERLASFPDSQDRGGQLAGYRESRQTRIHPPIELQRC